MNSARTRLWIFAAIFALPIFILSPQSEAQQLPIKSYTFADGLAQNDVNKMFFDSRGFIWFCTHEGLSRFDGYKFVNYGTENGLPNPNVTEMLETRTGDFWLGTDNGIVYFNPNGMPGANNHAKPGEPAGYRMFTVLNYAGISDNLDVASLLEDRNGRIWCGTDLGLLLIEKSGTEFLLKPTQLWKPQTRDFVIKSLYQDRRGRIWIGSFGTIYSISPDGEWQKHPGDGIPKMEVQLFFEDSDGRMWAGTARGLLEIGRAHV